MNSLKHGLRAEVIDVLPDEDAGAYRAHLDRWIAQVEPADEIERTLVERAARLAWQLKRADRAIDSRRVELRAARADRIDEEVDAVVEIGRRLLEGNPPPARSYADFGGYDEAAPSKSEADFNESARLVRRLESTVLGCGWLLDRWAEMREALEEGRGWRHEQRKQVYRLLGIRSDELGDDDRILMILSSRTEGSDTDDPGQWGAGDVPGGEDWSELLEMIAEEEARLEGVLEHRLVLRDASATVEEIDGSEMGELLRRYQATSDRALLKVLDSLRKLRRESGSAVTKAGRLAKAKAEPRPESEGASGLAGEIAAWLEAMESALPRKAPQPAAGGATPLAPNEPGGQAEAPPLAPNEPEDPTGEAPMTVRDRHVAAPNEPERPAVGVFAAPNEPDRSAWRVAPGSATLALLAVFLGAGLAVSSATSMDRDSRHAPDRPGWNRPDPETRLGRRLSDSAPDGRETLPADRACVDEPSPRRSRIAPPPDRNRRADRRSPLVALRDAW